MANFEMTSGLLVLFCLAVAKACLPDWNNQCGQNWDCCSGNCWRGNANWATGVCKPNNGPTTKQPPSGIVPSQSEFNNAVTSCTDMYGGAHYPQPTDDQYQKFVAGLNGGTIESKQEVAMALANYIMESGGLQFKRELACLNDGCPNSYTGAGCEVGNNRYYGRGYIQLSWCYNYRDAGRGLGRGDELLNNPDIVASNEQLAWDTSFWFWNNRVKSQYPSQINQGLFGYSIKAINGGLECGNPQSDFARKRDKRFEYYATVMNAFGLRANGDRSGC